MMTEPHVQSLAAKVKCSVDAASAEQPSLSQNAGGSDIAWDILLVEGLFHGGPHCFCPQRVADVRGMNAIPGERLWM